jgi:hypothetical protein
LVVLTAGSAAVVALIFIPAHPPSQDCSRGRMIYRWHDPPVIPFWIEEFGKKEF